MTPQELEALKGALNEQINYSTYFIQGTVVMQLIVVQAMLKSGVIDKGTLTEDVKQAIEALTEKHWATAFPNALTQLAKLLELEIKPPTKFSSEDAAKAEVARLIDRLKRQ